MQTGKSVPRQDAFDKVTGRAKYTGDLHGDALATAIVHARVAHGYVKSIDTQAAAALPGVVRIFTCFDVPKINFATTGHVWSLLAHHQPVADRRLLTDHVRFYGDEVAVVVAHDQLTANRAAALVQVDYETLPFVLTPEEALAPGAPALHPGGNLVAHTSECYGDYEAAIREPGLLCVDKWYTTPPVQHCHLENHAVCAYGEAGRIVVVSATQIPHILRRIIGQALGLPWGKIRVIKPYVGGGFGNKQDALTEPLAAWLSLQLGGRPVRIEMTREETFASTRTRHATKYHLISWLRKDGTLVARKAEVYSDQGAYCSHGHAIAATGLASLPQLYPCEHFVGDAYTVYTNHAVAGAMRAYGMPQVTWAHECHVEDICQALGVDSLAWRRAHIMPVGYVDEFTKNCNWADSFNQCFDKAAAYIDYDRKRALYSSQTGPVRRGVGVAPFYYGTGVYPISLEHSSCRLVLNQDGSIQLQVAETEIGQGADTAYAQMAADAVGLKDYRDVHVVSQQDTDVTPFGLGAYASRQTYMCSFSIAEAGGMLKEKILAYAAEMTGQPQDSLDLVESRILSAEDGRVLLELADLAMEAFYSTTHSQHLTAEASCQIKSAAFSFGCCCAEVEVDIPMCHVTVKNIINVHDCGRLVNPALAAAQVHGGMSMGLGYALSEEMRFDEKTGRLLGGNLLDYKLATTCDHPHLEAQFVENPEPTSPFGTKALGEPPVCPVAPAIRSAIFNATGVALDDLPMSPRRLHKAFLAAGLL